MVSTYLILSHVAAFSSLFVGSIFDLKTSEVPDSVSIAGVVSGIFLHFLASWNAGIGFSKLTNFSLMVSNPFSWLQALGDPLLWCLGVGAVFSIYGWGLYFMGMWGGADAFAMSVLGFGAPTAITGFSWTYTFDLFLNVLLAGFVYTLGFAIYKSLGSGALQKTYDRVKENEMRVSAEVIAAAALSALGAFTGGFNPLIYFSVFIMLIFLYEYMKVVQDDLMTEEKPVADLQPGEVLERGELDDDKVRGVREEEVEELRSSDIDKVKVREGVKFIPVFPIALAVTDLIGGGMSIFLILISL